jgi:hypothetical protein
VLLYKANTSENEIDIRRFENGIYVLKVINSKKVSETLKFIKI